MFRLSDPEVIFVLRNRAKWGEPIATLATAVWVHQKPLREVAAALSMSLHDVRQRVQMIRGVFSESSGFRRLARRQRKILETAR